MVGELNEPASHAQAIDVIVASGTSGILVRANQTLLRCWALSAWGPMPPVLMDTLTRGLSARAGLREPHPAWAADAVDALQCMAELACRERDALGGPDAFSTGPVAGDAAGRPAATRLSVRASGGPGGAAGSRLRAGTDPQADERGAALGRPAPAEAGRREPGAPDTALCRPPLEDWPALSSCGPPRGADASLVAAMCVEAHRRVLHHVPDGRHARLLPELMRAAGLLGCVPQGQLAVQAVQRIRDRAAQDFGAAEVRAAACALQLWAGAVPGRALAAATAAVGERALELAARGELSAEEHVIASRRLWRLHELAQQRGGPAARARPDAALCASTG